MASRLLMARVPEGAALIDNPSGGPQGFAMENVHVMAGIPRVMQAMLSTLEGELTTGPVIRSHTVRAYTGESSIADALALIQQNHPDADIGSYPFLREDRYGTHIVIRTSDVDLLRRIADAVMEAVQDIGETPEDLGLDADASA
jgi:molybdopterin-biosynthesis enzyme MoeA-like protein